AADDRRRGRLRGRRHPQAGDRRGRQLSGPRALLPRRGGAARAASDRRDPAPRDRAWRVPPGRRRPRGVLRDRAAAARGALAEPPRAPRPRAAGCGGAGARAPRSAAARPGARPMTWLHDTIAWLVAALVGLAAAIGLGGEGDPLVVQGYVEGEYVYVAAPVAGRLETLHVGRGAQVAAKTPLFELDRASERPGRDDAAARLARAEANLADLRKGKRPSELASIEAQLDQAQAMLELAAAELERRERLVASNVASREAVDQARATYQRDKARVAELTAELETAQLGARADEIQAAEAEVAAARAQLAEAEWRLDQMVQAAPQAGFVVDTLYRPGEWVEAGAPVISLLPPGNVKVRFFVPEPRLGAIAIGDRVAVACDACPSDLTAVISYIAPEAEYTPPVIYSREMRAKLVYLVEARPRRPAALRPGQPVDVTLAPAPVS